MLENDQLFDPRFWENQILHEALTLVIQSKKPWPMHRDLLSMLPPDFSDWFSQMAGWDVIDGEIVVKVMVRVRDMPDDELLGIAFARLARLVFDELNSNDFDVWSHQIDEWFENRHGYSRDEFDGDFLGFFIESEPGFSTRPDLWKQPKALYLDVRQIDFDDSRGRDYQLGEWKLIETREEWSTTQVQGLNFSSFSKRLMSQARNSEVVRHLDSRTYVWRSKKVFQSEPFFQPDWEVS